MSDSKQQSVPPPADRARLGITSTKRAHILDALDALDELVEQYESRERELFDTGHALANADRVAVELNKRIAELREQLEAMREWHAIWKGIAEKNEKALGAIADGSWGASAPPFYDVREFALNALASSPASDPFDGVPGTSSAAGGSWGNWAGESNQERKP